MTRHLRAHRWPVCALLLMGLAACGAGDSDGRGPQPGAGAAEPPAPPVAEAAPVDFEGTIQAGDGSQIWARAQGRGEAILVIHGGPGMDHTYLIPGLDPLARDFRLILYDQRGTGGSDAAVDARSITLQNFLTDMDAVLDFLDEDRVHLMAHSFGSMLAIAYVLRRPERVRSMVLIDPVEPGSKYEAETRAAQQARQTPEDRAALERLLASRAFKDRVPGAVNEMYRLTFRSTFADPSRIDELPLRMGERTARNGFEIPKYLMGGQGKPDLWGVLGQVEVPVLVVHGEADPTPELMVREMVGRMPDARLELLPDAGHFPWIEAPEPFFGVVREFLHAH
ncbi:MAG: alpha/beta fold hydrolase [Gemmatimonadetes bacterium]|nr:MAG: alpha/beta fold hydrolase [Gemmatimonadota bacterium]